jgi:hypothetical protein
MNLQTGWQSLPKGKRLLKANAEEVILTILSLHSTLLLKLKENEMIEKQGKLFWVTFGFLNLSKSDFPKIISSSMDNLLFILENVESSKMDPYFLFPLDPTKKDSCHMQQLLCSYIFSDSATLSESSLLILVMARIRLPGNTVDSAGTGVMYTLLYGLTFVFVRILKNDIQSPMVRIIF